MPLHAEAYMPEGLHDFPWKNLCHMWDVDFPRGNEHLRVKLWYPMGEGSTTPQQYHMQALVQHIEVWEWLEKRFELVDVPEFDCRGRAWLAPVVHPTHDFDTGVWAQRYDQLAVWGTFHLGKLRGKTTRR